VRKKRLFFTFSYYKQNFIRFRPLKRTQFVALQFFLTFSELFMLNADLFLPLASQLDTFFCAHTSALTTWACPQVARQYGGSAGLNMAAFPQLNFADQPLDSVNISS
jgi:hypothetical protein